MIKGLEKECSLSDSITIIPLLETEKRIMNTKEIILESKRVIAISLGALDFVCDMGTSLSKDRSEIFYARSKIELVANANNVQ